MFMGRENEEKPVNKSTLKESKDLLHRLIREQTIASREDYISAVYARNQVTPYKDTDPEIAEILQALERTLPTIPPLDDTDSEGSGNTD